MRIFHHHTNVFLAAFLVASIFCGCDQQDAKNQSSAKTATGKKAAPKSNAERSINELISVASSALSKNDIETAKDALTVAREKTDDDLQATSDVARLLFGAGEMKTSAEVYSKMLEIRPEIKPQLWQRGLALYYAERYEDGVDQFDTHQTHNSQDVENSVWQLLCKSKLSSVEEARKTMIQIEHDSRIPMKQVFDMFAGTGSPEEVIAASGYDAEKIQRNGTTYHAWLYVGLFHEMMGDQESSIDAMKTALKCKPFIPGLMGYVAEGHLRVRDAYPVDGE